MLLNTVRLKKLEIWLKSYLVNKYGNSSTLVTLSHNDVESDDSGKKKLVKRSYKKKSLEYNPTIKEEDIEFKSPYPEKDITKAFFRLSEIKQTILTIYYQSDTIGSEAISNVAKYKECTEQVALHYILEAQKEFEVEYDKIIKS